MKKTVVLVIILIIFTSHMILSKSISFNTHFKAKTMRLDYFHSGDYASEHFAVDRVVSDGIWSGSKQILQDELNLGLYRFEIYDKASNQILYSRGFASIFGEWQTIPEAKKRWGTFHAFRYYD